MATNKKARRKGVQTRPKIELSISCKKLRNMDRLSRSDPVCFLYNYTKAAMTADFSPKLPSTDIYDDSAWSLVERTEMIDNDLNPKFSKKFIVEYCFEEVQLYRVKLYDVDDKNKIDDLSKQDFIGKAEFTLADVVTAGKGFSKDLTSPTYTKSCGEVHITGEEVQNSEFMVTMKLSCTGLNRKNISGKVEPFFEISKGQEGKADNVVYRSKAMVTTLDPKSGNHDFIGKAVCTLHELTKETGRIKELELIHDGLKAKRFSRYHNSGILCFDKVQVIRLHTFMDYIRGGCSVNLIIAIDFTSSNGKATDPESLHYINPTNQSNNQYIKAIKSVASVLAKYDSDQKFPLFGFGAKIPPRQCVSHCFPLNFNDEEPEVKGIEGILDTYQFALGKIEFHGPTNFSSVLDEAIQYARSAVSQQEQHYYFLLIITDGIITDMDNSIDRIVKASDYPLSIVIVGVGTADFTDMLVLDADDKLLVDSKDKKMTRDIIQFVPFMEHKDNSMLAHETMAEIPKQFISYMENKKIVPNPPVDRPKQEASNTATKQVHLLSKPSLPSSINLSPEMTTPPQTGAPPYSVAN